MGFGIPAAIGAKMKAPDPCMLVLWRWWFSNDPTELGTIMQENLGVKIINSE